MEIAPVVSLESPTILLKLRDSTFCLRDSVGIFPRVEGCLQARGWGVLSLLPKHLLVVLVWPNSKGLGIQRNVRLSKITKWPQEHSKKIIYL